MPISSAISNAISIITILVSLTHFAIIYLRSEKAKTPDATKESQADASADIS